MHVLHEHADKGSIERIANNSQECMQEKELLTCELMKKAQAHTGAHSFGALVSDLLPGVSDERGIVLAPSFGTVGVSFGMRVLQFRGAMWAFQSASCRPWASK